MASASGRSARSVATSCLGRLPARLSRALPCAQHASNFTCGHGTAEETPFLPGQKGIQLSSFYKPSELSNLQAQIYYVTDDTFDGDRSNLRGHVSYGKSFGSNAPYLLFGYSRDELTENAQTIERSTVADRLSVSLNRSFLGEFLTLSLEHLMNAGDGTPDRSQSLGIFEGVTPAVRDQGSGVRGRWTRANHLSS